MRKSMLFTIEDIKQLSKAWIKENRWKENGDDWLDGYDNGVADGTEFVLFLLERWGE